MRSLMTRGICTSNIVTLITAICCKRLQSPVELRINFSGDEKIYKIQAPFSVTKRLDEIIPNSAFDGSPNEDGPLVIAVPEKVGVLVWSEFVNSGKNFNYQSMGFDLEPEDIIPPYAGRSVGQVWAYPTGHSGDDPW